MGGVMSCPEESEPLVRMIECPRCGQLAAEINWLDRPQEIYCRSCANEAIMERLKMIEELSK